ncbi:hypothetical protein ACI65C_000728 [Semiaphis heraclei]
MFTIIKVGSSVFFLGAQFFLYCYLLDRMNHERESVNFAIYSCDWMKMNIKFRTLLILTMRMNDANNLMIRASPKKVVNSQMFANNAYFGYLYVLFQVISITYNVVSVMLKTMNSNNKKTEQI